MTPSSHRIVSQLEIIRETAERFDDAMLAAAATAVPDGVGMDGLLAVTSRIPTYLNIALPELITDFAIANILDALRHVDSKLNDYISDGGAAHLVHALDAGLRNLHQALRDCYGLWQLGKRPWQARRLELRLGVPDIAGRPEACLVLKILIDGSEELAGRGQQYTGWHPDAILGPDSPRLEGVYHAPTIQPNPDGGDWRIGGIGIVPLVFDAFQYRAEVHRASTQRAWEAEP